MKIDPNEPAFPKTRSIDFDGSSSPLKGEFRPTYIESSSGLSIRAHFASMAMQGYLSSLDENMAKALPKEAKTNGNSIKQVLAQMAVNQADSLIAELNK